MPHDQIVVAGDVCVDWVQVEAPAQDGPGCRNWESHAGTHMVALPGGALMLARLVRAAVAGPTVISQQLQKLASVPPSAVVHSLATLAKFAYTTDPKGPDKKVYRVQQCGG